MSTSQEQLLETYNKLLNAPPGKWKNTAGDLCYFYIENGLTICSYLDKNDTNCISLYKVDNSGIIDNEIIIREKDTKELYLKFSQLYNFIKIKVSEDRFSLLQQKVHS